MPKKQILGSVMILIGLSFICMFIYDNFKVEENLRETKLVVKEKGNKLKLYYTDSKDRNYYLYGLDKIIVDYGDRRLELDNALRLKQITMNEVIKLIGKENEQSYWDGGTTKINNQDISLLQCNTIEGNKDYYFGPSDMEKREGFCDVEPYVCSFTKTYQVLDVSDSNDEMYIYLTLKMFQGEEVVTVKIEKSLMNDVVEDEYYEFKFTSMESTLKDDIKYIFDNHKLISIIKTDKIGFEQINESICR